MPAPEAAETVFTAEAESTLQPDPHWCVGAVPVVPLSALKLAPVLLSVREFAASVAPLETYPGPESVPQVAFGQYCLNTALLPALASPFTVTFQPAPLPVASATERLFIAADSVCAWPFSVSAGMFGTSGAVPNDSVPAVTENWVVSVAALAVAHGSALRATSAAAAASRRPGRRVRDRSTRVLQLSDPHTTDRGGHWSFSALQRKP